MKQCSGCIVNISWIYSFQKQFIVIEGTSYGSEYGYIMLCTVWLALLLCRYFQKLCTCRAIWTMVIAQSVSVCLLIWYFSCRASFSGVCTDRCSLQMKPPELVLKSLSVVYPCFLVYLPDSDFLTSLLYSSSVCCIVHVLSSYARWSCLTRCFILDKHCF